MNIGLIILWGIVIIFLIILIIVSIDAMYKYIKSKVITIPPNIQECAVAFDLLPDISTLNCCYIGESLTASKYVPSINMVVNPIPVYYLSVCENFCINGYNINTQTCNDNAGLESFNNCISISKPNGCIGVSLPVAASGVTYYYPSAATNQNCTDERPCKSL
jgi:hypothetical protein